MRGTLSQIRITDILLLATEGKKSGLLRLSSGKEVVDIFLAKGDIVHATCPIGEGEKSVLYPVTWSEGTFVLLPNSSPLARTITKKSGDLLAEVKAMSQEWERILQIIPTEKSIFRMADLGEDRNGPITIPHVGWRVLSKINGSRDVKNISETLRLPYAYTAKVIYNLYRSGLVEVVPAPKKPAEESCDLNALHVNSAEEVKRVENRRVSA